MLPSFTQSHKKVGFLSKGHRYRSKDHKTDPGNGFNVSSQVLIILCPLLHKTINQADALRLLIHYPIDTSDM